MFGNIVNGVLEEFQKKETLGKITDKIIKPLLSHLFKEYFGYIITILTLTILIILIVVIGILYLCLHNTDIHPTHTKLIS